VTRSLLDETDRLLARVIPRPLRVPLHFTALRLAKRGEQAMLARISEICPATGRALDVGANHGLYTFALARLAERVDAFEPQEECVRNLRAFGKVFAPNLKVHNVALSDSMGTVELNVPWFEGRLGRATLSGQASIDVRSDRSETVTVSAKRIDDFRFSDVGFVKIDVEGHEDRVIAGATETLERCRPILLIEIEQRHLASRRIEDVFARVENLRYRGGFHRRGVLSDLDEFDVKRDQAAFLDDADAVFDERYINMFIFRPA
jgi:FkbM family methyltransferase